MIRAMSYRPVRWLAYPFGGKQNFRPEYSALTEETGYEAVFSGHGGFIHANHAGAILPRVAVPEFRSVLNLELYLRGGLHWFYGLKHRAGLW